MILISFNSTLLSKVVALGSRDNRALRYVELGFAYSLGVIGVLIDLSRVGINSVEKESQGIIWCFPEIEKLNT